MHFYGDGGDFGFDLGNFSACIGQLLVQSIDYGHIQPHIAGCIFGAGADCHGS
jgi:hypothetical protein